MQIRHYPSLASRKNQIVIQITILNIIPELFSTHDSLLDDIPRRNGLFEFSAQQGPFPDKSDENLYEASKLLALPVKMSSSRSLPNILARKSINATGPLCIYSDSSLGSSTVRQWTFVGEHEKEFLIFYSVLGNNSSFSHR